MLAAPSRVVSPNLTWTHSSGVATYCGTQPQTLKTETPMSDRRRALHSYAIPPSTCVSALRLPNGLLAFPLEWIHGCPLPASTPRSVRRLLHHPAIMEGPLPLRSPPGRGFPPEALRLPERWMQVSCSSCLSRQGDAFRSISVWIPRDSRLAADRHLDVPLDYYILHRYLHPPSEESVNLY